MADDVDIANEFLQNAMQRALREIQQTSTSKVVTKFCKECEEEIPLQRRELGFQFCKECAEEREKRKALFADY